MSFAKRPFILRKICLEKTITHRKRSLLAFLVCVVGSGFRLGLSRKGSKKPVFNRRGKWLMLEEDNLN